MDNMQVNGVNSTVQVKPITTGKSVKTTQKQLPDVFQKKEFNIDNAMQTLQQSKYMVKNKGKYNEVNKFKEEDLKNLRAILTAEPKKWDSVSKLAAAPYVRNNTVIDLASRTPKVLDTMVPYATAVDKSGKGSKYKPKEVSTLADVGSIYGPRKLNAVKPLVKTQLSGENVALIALTPNLSKNADKVASKVLDMENAIGNNLKQIVFSGDTYDEKAYLIQASTKDNKITSEMLDKDLNRQAIENMSLYQSKGKLYQIKKVNDLRNNTTSKVRLEVIDGYPQVTHEIRVVKDKDGKVVRKEYTAPSDIPGVFDIKHVDAKGNQTVVSEGRIDKKTGLSTVKKDMTSLDGTKTTYFYQDDPQGNRISEYKIVDKNGKVLLNNNNTFEVVNENKFISTKNDQKYEINVDKHNINVVDLNNPKRKAQISIDKQIEGDKKEILKSLKAMPGEELFKLSQSTKKLVGTSDVLESYYDPGDKSIHSGSHLFVIMHELGHARDFRDADNSSDEAFEESLDLSISEDPQVQKVYEQERKAFNKAFPDTQRDHIDYFINKTTHYGGELGGLGETIAESNALLTTPKTHEVLGIRSQYLQQYFPRTIALLDQKSNEALA